MSCQNLRLPTYIPVSRSGNALSQHRRIFPGTFMFWIWFRIISEVGVNPVASSSSVVSFLISPFWELFPAKGRSEGFSPEGPSLAKASGEISGFSFGGLLSLLQCPCPFSQPCPLVLWVMNIEYYRYLRIFSPRLISPARFTFSVAGDRQNPILSMT